MKEHKFLEVIGYNNISVGTAFLLTCYYQHSIGDELERSSNPISVIQIELIPFLPPHKTVSQSPIVSLLPQQ